MNATVNDTCFWFDDAGLAQCGIIAHIFVFAAARRYAMIDTMMEFIGRPLRDEEFEVSKTGYGFASIDDAERSARDK